MTANLPPGTAPPEEHDLRAYEIGIGRGPRLVWFGAVSTRLMFSTTRLVGRRKDGKTQVGTAFFYDFKVDAEHTMPVLVTNRHVVEGCASGTFLLHEGVR